MAAMSGVVCVVTGASSGLGESIAVMLAERGAHVTLCGRDQERLQAALTLCITASGGHPKRFLTVTGDTTDASARTDIVKKTVETFGRLDVLVANAGIALPEADINANEATYDKLMDVNLKSVFFLIQAAVPHLETAKGNIVVMSSIASQLAAGTIYAMTKSAIDHMVRCLAVDLGPKNIRVNAVNPGWVPTNIIRHHIGSTAPDEVKLVHDKFTESQVALQPLGKSVVTREAVAEAVCYLAGPAAGFVTGQCLLVDAGRLLAGARP